jgi:Raf kinase inhibitor-like YbhB/YbcL family protein
MKTYGFFLALTLGASSLAACSGTDSTGTTSTSSSSETTATSSATTGAGGAGTGGAGGGSTGGAGGGATGSTGSSTSSSTGSGGMAAFALTSTGFTEGMVIPAKYACAGADGSPDLSWTAGPAGTLSYAVVLTDKSNNLLHWVIWDIPGATTSLPAGVEKKANPAVPAGSKQAKSFDNQTFGYRGPCPQNTHTYEFAVFALDVATLPGVTTASTRAEVNTEILKHDLTKTTLTGTYTP